MLQKLDQNKIRLLLAAALGLLVVTVYLYLRPKQGSPVGHELAFHPDAVLALEWKDGQNQFQFQRENRNALWSPEVSSQLIQRKLNFLAMTSLKEMSPPSSGLEVVLSFGEGNTWVGRQSGSKFVWTEGLKKGFGFDLDELMLAQFQEGKWTFEDHSFDWCDSRPKRILGDDLNQKIVLINENGAWKRVEGTQGKLVDGTTVEKWLGANCKIKVDLFREESLLSSRSLTSQGKFEVEFESGKKVSWKKGEHFWRATDQLSFLSQQFDLALTDLIRVPSN